MYFYDECLEASIVTDVLDFNEELEMRCTDAGDFKGWRVGARLPAGSNAWYEKYEGYSVEPLTIGTSTSFKNTLAHSKCSRIK